MIKIKQSKNLIYLAIGIAIYWGGASWFEKPYCNIEHQDVDTIRGPKPAFKYFVSKLISQRRELNGKDDYAMYVYVNAPKGIRYAVVVMDGRQLNLNIPIGLRSFTHELEGVKTIGKHKYELYVMDCQGGKGYSKCYMKIDPDAD
jgi:hypothetical protein